MTTEQPEPLRDGDPPAPYPLDTPGGQQEQTEAELNEANEEDGTEQGVAASAGEPNSFEPEEDPDAEA